MPLKAIGKAIGGAARAVGSAVGSVASSGLGGVVGGVIGGPAGAAIGTGIGTLFGSGASAPTPGTGIMGPQVGQEPKPPLASLLPGGGHLPQPQPQGVPLPVTLAPPAQPSAQVCQGGSATGFLGWLARHYPEGLRQYASMIGTVLQPFKWPTALVSLYDQYCASLTAPGGGQTPSPMPVNGSCDVTGLFPFQTVLPADTYTAVLKPPPGYVTVTAPNGQKCFVLKEMARKAGLWKPRPKPAVTAADMRTLTKAASTAKKLDRLHAKAADVTGRKCSCKKRR